MSVREFYAEVERVNRAGSAVLIRRFGLHGMPHWMRYRVARLRRAWA